MPQLQFRLGLGVVGLGGQHLILMVRKLNKKTAFIIIMYISKNKKYDQEFEESQIVRLFIICGFITIYLFQF